MGLHYPIFMEEIETGSNSEKCPYEKYKYCE